MPYRNCKGIASQHTARTAWPGLPSRQVLTTPPHSSCPLSPGTAPSATQPRPTAFAPGCSREASQIWPTAFPTDNVAAVPQKGHPREKRSRHPLAAECSQLGTSTPAHLPGERLPARRWAQTRPSGSPSRIFGPAAARDHISPEPEHIPFPAKPASSTRAGARLWNGQERTRALGRAGAAAGDAAAEPPPSSWIFSTLVLPAGNEGPQ